MVNVTFTKITIRILRGIGAYSTQHCTKHTSPSIPKTFIVTELGHMKKIFPLIDLSL